MDSEAQVASSVEDRFTSPQQNVNPEKAQSSVSNSQHEQIKIELTTEPSITAKGQKHGTRQAHRRRR